MFILGLIIFAVIILLVSFWHGVGISSYIELNGLFIVFGGIIATIMSTNSLKVFINGTKAILKKNVCLSNDEKEVCSKLFSLLSKTSIISGVIGFIIGALTILVKLDDIKKLGPSLGLALLSLLYGLLIGYFVFIPAKFRIESLNDKQ